MRTRKPHVVIIRMADADIARIHELMERWKLDTASETVREAIRIVAEQGTQRRVVGEAPKLGAFVRRG